MRKTLAGLLLVGLLLAGCSTPSQTGDIGSPAGAPSRHDLATNSPVAVPAGDVYSATFTAQGSIRMDFDYRASDDSAVDIGFVRASDLAEYTQGASVTTWAYRSNTLQAQAGSELPAGQYAFVIHCRNSVFDCDGIHSLWGTY